MVALFFCESMDDGIASGVKLWYDSKSEECRFLSSKQRW